MKKFLLLTILLSLVTTVSNSQKIQSPWQFLDYEIGSKFTRHHHIIEYFNYLNKQSTNVLLEKYGTTNEERTLIVSYISSEENLKNLEQIRKDNLKRVGILNGNPSSNIAIVWLSYNVHGNEASSTEAAMNTVYKLITEKQEWLKNTVVILDPVVNPDGRDRYVNWYKQTKNSNHNNNPDVVEHSEPWPSGRPNHYLFDLNRDWAWATQVETQQRLKIYNKWMPHIHVDFHEQFINSPYYFPPAAEPYHEIITKWQRDFQTEIGKNHAKYFDQKGWQYFTKESFDLFYPSYGDSYPTYMGAIGMTYEQAGHGKAGLGILTENNTELTLKDRIDHHTTTGLSTVEMASKNAVKLVDEFEHYFDNSKLKYKSYILRGNSEKIEQVRDLLSKHDISSHPASKKTVKAYDYSSKKYKSIKTTAKDWVITTNQPKGKMVKVLFEPETKLTDSLTYDITAWSIPYAYGLEGFASEESFELKNDDVIVPESSKVNKINTSAYAYLAKWQTVNDAQFLGDLLEQGINIRFNATDFSIEGNNYKKGTLIIMRGENSHIHNFDEVIVEIANRIHKIVIPVKSGFVDSGADFGSNKVSLVKRKNIAVLSGEETSSLSFGEIWHFFETQLNYPLNILKANNLNRYNLSKYHVLILPNGYRANKDRLKILSKYVSDGGTIIGVGSALNNFADNEEYSLKSKNQDDKEEINFTPYNQRKQSYISSNITGSIFKSKVDNTHPLAFGYKSNYNSLKLSGKSYQLLNEGINVAYFSKDAEKVSGFAGYKAMKEIPNSLLYGIEYKGRGKIIYMVDNPLFRSFWENGKLFFANAVFLN